MTLAQNVAECRRIPELPGLGELLHHLLQARLLPLHLVEGRQDLLHELFANGLAVLLQDLPRHVERQVMGVDDALHESQIVGHEIPALVYDEDAGCDGDERSVGSA
jgi:hypothetical protein